MYIDEHGGGCCGITHIFSFYPEDQFRVSLFKRQVKKLLDDQYEDAQVDGYESNGDWDDPVIKEPKRKFSCILEATLTDQQMMFWAPHLKEAGFKIVNRFLNSNSGNVVNVLHYNPAGRRKMPEVPYKW